MRRYSRPTKPWQRRVSAGAAFCHPERSEGPSRRGRSRYFSAVDPVRVSERHMRKPKKRKLRLFARPVMPPARFHTTKHGKRGYVRRESRKDERRAKEDTGE